MFTVIHNTSMFCSMTLWQTVLKKSNLYFIFLLRKWIISSNKICQVVQCAMSKTSSQYVVAKTCTSLTITAYTFYFGKCFGKKFLWTYTPRAFSIWISCLIFNKKNVQVQTMLRSVVSLPCITFCLTTKHFDVNFYRSELRVFSLIVIMIVRIFSMLLDY